MMLIKIEKDLLHLKVHTASGRFTDLLTEIDMHFHFVSRPDQGNRKSNSPETSFPSFYSRINNYIFLSIECVIIANQASLIIPQ